MEKVLGQYLPSDIIKYIFNGYYYGCDTCNKKIKQLININNMDVCEKCSLQILSTMSKYSKFVDYIKDIFKTELPYFCYKYEIPTISYKCYCTETDEHAMDREVYVEEMRLYHENLLTCLFPSFIKKPIRPPHRFRNRSCADDKNKLVERMHDERFLFSLLMQKHVNKKMAKKIVKMDNSNILLRIKSFEMMKHIKELYNEIYTCDRIDLYHFKSCFLEQRYCYDMTENLFKHLLFVQFLLSNSHDFEKLKSYMRILVEIDRDIYCDR